VDTFPYSKGLVPVVCSWFVSPLSAGLSAALLFFFNRLVILRRQNSTNMGE
jgi:sodium-dependent phosphate transporter